MKYSNVILYLSSETFNLGNLNYSGLDIVKSNNILSIKFIIVSITKTYL
jgi:hypothetical protein